MIENVEYEDLNTMGEHPPVDESIFQTEMEFINYNQKDAYNFAKKIGLKISYGL